MPAQYCELPCRKEDFFETARAESSKRVTARDTRSFLGGLNLTKSQPTLRQLYPPSPYSLGCVAVGNHTFLPDGRTTPQSAMCSMQPYQVLEVSCQRACIDAQLTRQTAPPVGVPVRPASRVPCGPLAYLYRCAVLR